jgi:hypothetical protein
MNRNAGARVRRTAGVVAGLLAAPTVMVSVGGFASAASAARLAKVTITAGRFVASGTAQVSGKLPKAHPGKPKAFALSHNTSFGSGDVTLGSASMKAPKGAYRGWVSLPDIIATGAWDLLACDKATPTSASCFAVGKVHVTTSAAPTVATPKLEKSRAVSHTFIGRASSITATGSNGTKYTLKLPASDQFYPATLTPVSSLSPAGAVGQLLDGVMITPLGDAPPGATLVIKPPKKLAAKARIVGFGGIDPAGAAVDLPVAFGKTATIPLASFGGYGIVTPPGKSSKLASSRKGAQACGPGATAGARQAQPAAAGSRPLMSCISSAKRLQELSDSLQPEIAKARQDQLMGKEESSSVAQDIENALNAGLAAIDDEAAQVIQQQPPTDEGAAELNVLAGLALGVSRQEQLLGLPDAAATALIGRILKYEMDNLKEACKPGGPAKPAVVLLAHATQAFNSQRQLQLFGAADYEALAEQVQADCLRRAKVELDVTDTSDISDTELDVNAAVTAKVMITGQDDAQAFSGVALHAPDATLTYKSSKVTVQPLWVEVGETATLTSTSGVTHTPEIGYWAQGRVRCDKNRKFVFDYSGDIRPTDDEIWQDVQKIQTAINGTVIGTRTGGVEQSAWSKGFGAGKLTSPLVLPLDDTAPTKKSYSSSCGSAACNSYSYDATFDAVSQNG